MLPSNKNLTIKIKFIILMFLKVLLTLTNYLATKNFKLNSNKTWLKNWRKEKLVHFICRRKCLYCQCLYKHFSSRILTTSIEVDIWCLAERFEIEIIKTDCCHNKQMLNWETQTFLLTETFMWCSFLPSKLSYCFCVYVFTVYNVFRRCPLSFKNTHYTC